MHLFKYLPFVPLAACWGELGHRTVAYLAQKHLTKPVQQWVDHILGGEDISTAAIWPDEIKNRTRYGYKYAYASAWHYYNVNGSFAKGCTLDSKDITMSCEKKGCAIEAIANHTERVENRTLSANERTEALRFVLHFIGDIHQPLHTEFTKVGGNEICVRWGKTKQTTYNDTCASRGFDNLHNVWDSYIVEKLVLEKYNITTTKTDEIGISDGSDGVKIAALRWSEVLYNAKDPLNKCSCADSVKCAFGWTQRSNKLVCSNVLANGIPKEDEDLSKAYYNNNKDVAEAQVKLAGLTLAAWINQMAVAAGLAVDLPTLQIQPELKR